MPKHARPKLNSLLRTAATVTVAAAAAALAASGSASASSAPALTDSALGSDSAVGSTVGSDSALGYALGPVKHLTINPLANTGTDPLDNVVAPQVADFKPVSTGAVTGPLSQGDSVSELPLVGQLSGLLPG